MIRHNRGDVEITASWCVDPSSSVKQVRLRLVNRGHRAQALRLIGIMEWMMGANRSDRDTVRTLLHQHTTSGQKITALLATQTERSGGFGEGTAFLCMASAADARDDWTCDRRECFNEFGQLSVPHRFGQKSGIGFDPCAALSTRVALDAGEAVERVFVIGYAENANAARELVARSTATTALDRIDAARSHWDEVLSNTTVKTPDPLFDAMVNRWLLYQTGREMTTFSATELSPRFVLETFVPSQPLFELDELQRVGGRHEDLAEERIGIEGDRRDERVQLIGGDGWRSRVVRGLGVGAPGIRPRSRRDQQRRAEDRDGAPQKPHESCAFHGHTSSLGR